MFTIYKIVSPSGKCYIGLTSLKLRDRWDAHCTRAFHAGRKHHPFCCAIRKYGKAAFITEVLETAEDLEAAKAAEIRWIAAFKSNERAYGYNLSAGGDYDSETGKLAMRQKMRDPEFNARYRANLSAAVKKRDPKIFDALADSARKWRKENPVQVYKIGRRAVRIATAAQNRPWTGTPDKVIKGQFGRLWIPGSKVLRARRSYFHRKSARNQWATISLEDKTNVLAKIAESHRINYAENPERRAKNFEQIKKARANVDRKKQGAAASAGQKKWWAELRKDPERYAAYLETRRASFAATIRARADVRHSQCGAEE